MATIDIKNVTNEEETGIFDQLMRSISANIEKQYLNNRITGSDYATVYLGSIQAALTQSIQFALQEDIVEAQITGIEADNALKADQLLTSKTERSIKTFELTNILPEQVTKIQEEIDILQAQEKLAYTERVLKDKQAAKLGLDNVMKVAEEDRASNSSLVYRPKYEEL